MNQINTWLTVLQNYHSPDIKLRQSSMEFLTHASLHLEQFTISLQTLIETDLDHNLKQTCIVLMNNLITNVLRDVPEELLEWCYRITVENQKTSLVLTKQLARMFVAMLIKSNHICCQSILAVLRDTILTGSLNYRPFYVMYKILGEPLIGKWKFQYINLNKLKQAPISVHTQKYLMKIILEYSSHNRSRGINCHEVLLIFARIPHKCIRYLLERLEYCKENSEILAILDFLLSKYLNSSEDVDFNLITEMCLLVDKCLQSYSLGSREYDSKVIPFIEKYFCYVIKYSSQNDNNLEQYLSHLEHLAKYLKHSKLQDLALPTMNKLFSYCIGTCESFKIKELNVIYVLIALCLEYMIEEISIGKLIKKLFKEYEDNRLKLGILCIFRSYLKVIPTRESPTSLKILALAQEYLPNESILSHSKILLWIIFSFNNRFNEQMLQQAAMTSEMYSEEERCQYINCMAYNVDRITVSYQIFYCAINMINDYNCNGLPVRSEYLILLIAIIKRYQFTEITFSDLIDAMRQIDPKDYVQLERYSYAAIQMLKIYNSSFFEIYGYMKFNLDLLNNLMRLHNDAAYCFIMEFINIPTKNFEHLHGVVDIAIANLHTRQSRLYDILEIFVIMYPVSGRKYADRILQALDNQPEYFRFYFRLKPDKPIKRLNFQPKNIFEYKWVLLSLICQNQRLDQSELSKEKDLEDLTRTLQQLSINQTQKQQYHRLLLQMNQMQQKEGDHWIGEWKTSNLNELIKKDSKLWKVEYINRKYAELFGICYESY